MNPQRLLLLMGVCTENASSCYLGPMHPIETLSFVYFFPDRNKMWSNRSFIKKHFHKDRREAAAQKAGKQQRREHHEIRKKLSLKTLLHINKSSPTSKHRF